MVGGAGLSSATGYDLADVQRQGMGPPLRANPVGSSASASLLKAGPVH